MTSSGTKDPLTALQRRMIAAVCPGAQIVAAEYFQKEYTPGPMRVTVRSRDGREDDVVLRISRHGSVLNEARLLPVLSKLGLPVPEVLAGPERDPDLPEPPYVAVYSLLLGVDLQQFSLASDECCQQALRLVIAAARRLAAVTTDLRAEPSLGFLPTTALSDQLDAVVGHGGPWMKEHVFADAAEIVRPFYEVMGDTTVFTAGDYQPANFLTDGVGVTGFVDFELAGYQDFLYGFVKYPIYDMLPFMRNDFVRFLLGETGATVRAFNLRLVLGCLGSLHREIPVRGGNGAYRNHVKQLLTDALNAL